MSHSYYTKKWQEAQGSLVDLLQQEIPTEPPKPERDRVAAFQLLATMYIKYIQVMRQLEQCYDQIVHPQKRRVLRHCLDGVMGRVVELKLEMINLEFSEYHYFDDILSDLKLTPRDVEIPIPHYFLSERSKALKEREKMLSQILVRFASQDTGQDTSMQRDQAIRLIQVHERARQGRLRARFMREIRLQEEREKLAQTRGAPTMDPDVAAMMIQKIWKGFSQRRKTRKEREEEMVFIGMIPPPLPNLKELPQTLALITEEDRRRMQDLHEQEFQQALITVRNNLLETEGPHLKETMMDQIRQWFIECRDATGKFPEYPDEDDGGSEVIFKEKDPEELEKELREKQEDNKDKGKEKGKGDNKKKDEKKEKKAKKDKEEEEKDEGWLMAPSNFVPTINDATAKYRDMWHTRPEEDNFSQKHDVELIKEEKRKDVEVQIRQQVDELMRTELNNLKAAVDREKAKKGKKKKKGKKLGKKKKGKKEKDLTPDRTIEDLYEELVTHAIIIRPRNLKLADYEGEFSYLGSTLRQANIEPMPSLSDVRRLITEFAILPLGSAAVHEQAPLTKSLLLAGPRGVGKKMLVHAICNEVGANLFDLSAANLVGKYPGRDGLKMLMHLIFKVGRALQPSVFFVGDCEKMFKKKIPKNDHTEPKRLKKELPKALKTIKPEDRLLLVGTTRFPFDADMKKLLACYHRTILIPRPDYASRHLLWRRLITKHNGVLHNHFDISSLAKVTDGYTPGQIVTAIQQVLTERRVQYLNLKPLQSVEFVTPLARIDPIFKEEEEAFKNWYVKTPLGKKRAKAAAGDEEDLAGGKDKDKKKKGAEKGNKNKKK